MNVKRILAAGAACALLLPLPGCLSFKSSLDLSPDASGASQTAPQQSAVAPSAASTAPGAPVTTAPATTLPGANTTTAPGTTASDAANTTAAPAGPGVPAGNEYDILRSGNFSFSAAMENDGETQEMEISVSTAGDLYVTADVDGLVMGVLVKNKKTYLLYPPQKKYLELNDFVLGVMNLDPSEFTGIADDLGFTEMKSLEEADSVSEGADEGTACKIYSMSYSDGTSAKVYLAGTKLIAMENYGANGALTNAMKFKSVTAGFPQMPPSDYSKSGYMEFLGLLASGMS